VVTDPCWPRTVSAGGPRHALCRVLQERGLARSPELGCAHTSGVRSLAALYIPRSHPSFSLTPLPLLSSRPQVSPSVVTEFLRVGHTFSCSHLPAEPQPWACSRKRRRRRRPRGRLGLRHQAWKVRDCCEVDWHRMVVGAMYFEGVSSRAAYRRVATNIHPVLLPFVCHFPFGQMRSAPFCSSAQIPSLT